MNYIDVINENIVLIMLGVSFISLILFILVIVLFVKIANLNRKYRSFIKGNDGKSLEEIILTRLSEIDYTKDVLDSQQATIKEIKEKLLSPLQKVGIIKYDAFKEMGGKLSFVLAVLDDNNSGFILNSMHSSREGCYTYLKEIIHGESFIALAEEEKQALDQAISSKNFME